MKAQITFAIILLLFATARGLNNVLPNLIKKQFTQVDRPAINVTVGEIFRFGLPSFDSLFNPQHYSIYQLGKDQYQSAVSLLAFESQQNKNKQIEAGKSSKILSENAPFVCVLQPSKMEISQQVKVVHQQSSRIHNSVNWQQNQYIHLPFRSLLYVLNPSTSQLTAYFYSESNFELLAAHKFYELMDHSEEASGTPSSPLCIAANSRQDIVYIFSNIGIWEVKTRTILANVKRIDTISGFSPSKIGGLDAVLHGDSGILVALKRRFSVFLIPQPKTGSSLSSYKEITMFGDTKMVPQDIKIIGSTLFVLDFFKGIFVFKIVGSGQTREHAFIPFQTFGGNYQFHISQNSIFMSYNDFQGSKIVEISYNDEQKTASLVRYIKDAFISSIQAFTVLTSVPSWQLKKRFSQDAYDSLLFYISNFDQISVYPFNTDPRTINKAVNGVKLRLNDIRRIFFLGHDRYLLVTQNNLRYVKLKIQKPVISCKTFRAQGGQNLSKAEYFKLVVKSNASTCQHKKHSNAEQSRKIFFNEYCALQTHYFLHINDPQQTQLQKAILYAVVLIVVVGFIAGLFCLIQWRNNKMVILGRLKDQIVRFRNKHKKMQPFVEENNDQHQIQIEVPEVHIQIRQ